MFGVLTRLRAGEKDSRGSVSHLGRWISSQWKGLSIGTESWKGLAICGLCVAAIYVFGEALKAKDPISSWLFWDFAKIYVWQIYFGLACVSFGYMLLRRVFRIELCGLESVVLSMGLGVLSFVLFMYLGGALGWYNSLFAVLLPAGMFVLSLRTTFGVLFREAAGRARLESALSRHEILALAYGFAGITLLYLQCATPFSIQYDAGWSHLTIADDFAREGRIVPFVGFTPKNLPHLASLLYTWAFLLPGLPEQALHWMAAQHLEFQLFLWTLVGVIPAVRYMVPGVRARASWAVFFLFPGFFVYDSNLGAAADHVAGFFALPFFLASVRAVSSFSPGLTVLSGLFAGALLHTKFQCMYLVAPVAVMFSIRWLVLFVAWLRRSEVRFVAAEIKSQLIAAPFLFTGAALVGFGPHLLTNWIFYRNPFYPLLLKVFRSSTPWPVDYPYDPMVAATAVGDLGYRFKDALKVMFTFSFVPHYSFIGGQPVFGSLYTLLLPLGLLFLKKRTIWQGILLAQGAVLMWALVYQIDRNLQLLLPWLAAVSAALVAASFQGSMFARLGATALVLLHVAWGSKFMVAGGEERVLALVKLVQDNLKERKKKRYDEFRRSYRELGEKLPTDATLLLHTEHLHLGIHRRTLGDWAGWQYAIDYRDMDTPRDVYRRYKELGVTHIAWNALNSPSLKQEEVLFHAFVSRHAEKMESVREFSLWKMPRAAPPKEDPLNVVAFGLRGYRDGLYAIRKLGVIESLGPDAKQFPPPDRETKDAKARLSSLRISDAALIGDSFTLGGDLSATLHRCFQKKHHYSGHTIHLRRRSSDDGPEEECR